MNVGVTPAPWEPAALIFPGRSSASAGLVSQVRGQEEELGGRACEPTGGGEEAAGGCWGVRTGKQNENGPSYKEYLE